jgi:hypothetical protein
MMRNIKNFLNKYDLYYMSMKEFVCEKVLSLNVGIRRELDLSFTKIANRNTKMYTLHALISIT